jgi:hypothetical protein
MNPIPVTERLPECHQTYRGQESYSVLAYDNGWAYMIYVKTPTGSFWEYDAMGVSGYEWEVERSTTVTHWMPDPPPPKDTP